MAAKKEEPKDKAGKDEAAAPPSPEELLAALQKKVKLSQLLIIITAVLSVGLGGGALVWAAITASSVKNLEPEPANAINDKIDSLEQRLSMLFAKQDEFQFKVESTYSSIEEIRNQRQERDFGPIQKILVEQRTDYNDMLAILNTGVLALANMMRGTRDWTQTYTKRIEQAIEINRARIETINNLPKESSAKPTVAPTVKQPQQGAAATASKSDTAEKK
jgi:hypothetical protein